jgi:hypothetical protein
MIVIEHDSLQGSASRKVAFAVIVVAYDCAGSACIMLTQLNLFWLRLPHVNAFYFTSGLQGVSPH